MEIIERNGLRILKAAQGMTLQKKGDETHSFSQIIYLGSLDTQDNYEEITLEKAEKLMREYDNTDEQVSDAETECTDEIKVFKDDTSTT